MKTEEWKKNHTHTHTHTHTHRQDNDVTSLTFFLKNGHWATVIFFDKMHHTKILSGNCKKLWSTYFSNLVTFKVNILIKT
jgi:hypothetical protein